MTPASRSSLRRTRLSSRRSDRPKRQGGPAPDGAGPLLDEPFQRVLRWADQWAADEELSVNALRTREVLRARDLGGTGPEVFETRAVSIPGPAGSVAAMVYRPTPSPAAGTLVWMHGGGWVAGSAAAADTQARALAKASGCVVLAVDYGLAPERPFPGGLEDCYAAVTWAAANAPEIGAGGAALAVGGESAGGNLAAAVTLLARDRGGPAIAFQLLAYPVLSHGFGAPSWRRFADGYWLSSSDMEWFWAQYLDDDGDGSHELASPLRARSLAGLPRALIMLAECDILHDEGAAYGSRLAESGVPAEVRSYAGCLHGFLACAGVVDHAWTALEDAGRAVGRALEGAPGAAASIE